MGGEVGYQRWTSVGPSAANYNIPRSSVESMSFVAARDFLPNWGPIVPIHAPRDKLGKNSFSRGELVSLERWKAVI